MATTPHKINAAALQNSTIRQRLGIDSVWLGTLKGSSWKDQVSFDTLSEKMGMVEFIYISRYIQCYISLNMFLPTKANVSNSHLGTLHYYGNI